MYIYDEKFYDRGNDKSKKGAEHIIPYVINTINPKSVIDFGCGEGIWLSVVKKCDEKIEIMGLDGEYINLERLQIPKECFLAKNLENPVKLNRKYDLAMSLEVAEHLSKDSAEIFVDSLTNASDNILFSAAIPGQEGDNHINEQWQSYWVEKFEARGFVTDYSLREYFWNETGIEMWKRQNILFFSRKKVNFPVKQNMIDVVHPEMFYLKTEQVLGLKKRRGIKEIYIILDKCLKNVLEKGEKNIVIYPFGQNGFLCKEILNYKYGIKELAIVDNKLCATEENIISAQQVNNLGESFFVIDTCSNLDIHLEVLQEIEKYISSDKIISAFEI